MSAALAMPVGTRGEHAASAAGFAQPWRSDLKEYARTVHINSVSIAIIFAFHAALLYGLWRSGNSIEVLPRLARVSILASVQAPLASAKPPLPSAPARPTQHAPKPANAAVFAPAPVSISARPPAAPSLPTPSPSDEPAAMPAAPAAPITLTTAGSSAAPVPAAARVPAVLAAAAQPVPVPPPKLEPPSTDAAYLHNPNPAYPPVSKRLNEQGQVLLRVLVSADGKAELVEIKTSSGFDRLDASALRAVSQWRFVPGKRGGVAEAMWFLVPVNFALS